jgi:hypothetical protein
LVASFTLSTYNDRQERHATGEYNREQSWMFTCDPGDQLAIEPTGRFPDQHLAPHSIRVFYREWGGYADQKPSEGRAWTVEVRAINPKTTRPPMLVSPQYLKAIWYLIEDDQLDGAPDVDVRAAIEMELHRHR